MVLTFAILAVTILLFAFSKLRSDLVSVLSLLALFLAGILTPHRLADQHAGAGDQPRGRAAGLAAVMARRICDEL